MTPSEKLLHASELISEVMRDLPLKANPCESCGTPHYGPKPVWEMVQSMTRITEKLHSMARSRMFTAEIDGPDEEE